FSAFNNFTMSLWLSQFALSYVLISLFGNSRSLEGAVVGPIAGAWSDRTYLGWLGRRRPFVLVGGLGTAVLLALTPLAARAAVPGGWGLASPVAALAPMLAVVFLFTLFFNVAEDAHKALLADLTEGPARTRLAALSAVANIGGQAALLLLGFLAWSAGVPDGAFLVAAALVAAGVVGAVLGVREPTPRAWEAVRPEVAGDVAPARESVVALLRGYRGAAALCLVTFLYWSGVNAVLPLVSIYTRDILGATVGEAQLLPALLLAATTAAALPVGFLGERFGKRRVIAGGYVVMCLAALAGLVVTTKEQGAAVFLLAGLGNAAGVVLTVPLLADMVPRHHMGKATGLLAAAGSVAAPLSSLVAGSLADHYGPRAIFAVMAVMVALALAALPATLPPRRSTRPLAAALSAG
ncbi:MAG TPA: MFS transporter, partial [Chloroflexota bacterium]